MFSDAFGRGGAKISPTGGGSEVPDGGACGLDYYAYYLYGWGFAPDPTGKAYAAPPGPQGVSG